MIKNILWKFVYWLSKVKDWNYSEINGWNQSLMLVISLEIRFWDFSLDFTERVTYVTLEDYKVEILI